MGISSRGKQRNLGPPRNLGMSSPATGGAQKRLKNDLLKCSNRDFSSGCMFAHTYSGFQITQKQNPLPEESFLESHFNITQIEEKLP